MFVVVGVGEGVNHPVVEVNVDDVKALGERTRRVLRGRRCHRVERLPLSTLELIVKNCLICGCQIAYRERDFRWVHTKTSTQTSGHLCWPGVSKDVATPDADQ